jgi:hypothetical protein
MEDTIIIQNAVKHHSGLYLVSHGPIDKVQYEDIHGNVITMGGGTQYFEHSKDFPGKGCEDYCLVHQLSLDSEIINKLLFRVGHTNSWKPASEMTIEELEARLPVGTSLMNTEGGLMRPVDLMVIQYWIAKRKADNHDVQISE